MQDEILILGGGVAGCAAAIALARKGHSVTVIEREPTPRHECLRRVSERRSP